MYMKRIFLLALLPFLVAFQNYNKAFAEQPKIKEIINPRTKNVLEYSYNPDGKIVSVKNSKGIVTTYRYLENAIIKTSTDLLKAKSNTDTLHLNERGLAYPDRNKYDAEGYLVETNQHGTTRWVIENGNEKSTTYFDETGKAHNTVSYFYSDKHSTIGNWNMGITFLGHGSKNLLKETVGIGSNGDTIAHSFYKYQFDEKNRVIGKVVHNKSGGLEDSILYKYY